MSYALKITGKVLPNQHQTESTNPGLAELDNREPVDFTIPTPIPNTVANRPTTGRNGAIDGNWNKSTHLQAESSIKSTTTSDVSPTQHGSSPNGALQPLHDHKTIAQLLCFPPHSLYTHCTLLLHISQGRTFSMSFYYIISFYIAPHLFGLFWNPQE